MDSRLEAGLPQFSVRPKILAVDDQVMNIRLIHELFSEDFDVFMATDGLQAISKAQDLMPDLILLDVVMPGMDGYEVCRRLKADAKTTDIPIIFITGNFDEQDEVKGFELGASDFIHKPINAIITRARINTQLALKQQADQLRSIALMDGLTGVANRRKFDREFATAWKHCLRYQLPLTLMMIDVDFFKRFNDHYGHQLGDSCLQWVARAINKTLKRPQDLAARYGGEEFACVLPDTNSVGASIVAEQVLQAVLDLRLDHAHSDAGSIVSVSIGVATEVPQVELDHESLIVAADQQLYKAKQAGRAQAQIIDLDVA